MQPEELEILEDRTSASRCDQGFLRLRRLWVRHRYAGGAASPPYACDVVSRRGVDAVAVLLWWRAPNGPAVLLKEGVRPPIWLRRQQALVRPDPQAPLVLAEIVAGMLEPEDHGPDGPRRRARIECREEAGVEVAESALRPLGGHSFPSPGISDERVDYFEAELAGPPDLAANGLGDGSGMEHGTRLRAMSLAEALAACRAGAIPDMKTEVALGRLADRLGIRR